MKIFYKILAIIAIISTIPLSFLGYIAVNKTMTAGTEINTVTSAVINKQAEENMTRQVEILARHVESQLLSYMNDIKLISKHPDIQNMMRQARDTGILEDNTASTSTPKELQVARFYPKERAAWQNLQNYFMSVYNERTNDIDLIRIFYSNGYVVNGVANGKEDVNDYKGDKSWFVDTMNIEKTKATDYYVSPISVARRTNSSAIRYMAPIEVDGARLGLININFKADSITKEIQNFTYGRDGFAMFIDTNYENAEGKRSDFPVVVSKKTTNNELYLIDETKPAPISTAQLKGGDGYVSYVNENGDKMIGTYEKINWQDKTWYVVVVAPQEQVMETVSNTQSKLNSLILATKNSLIVIVLITIAMSILISILFSRSITNPINKLVAAGKKIADGDLSAEVPEIKTSDEIGELAMTINLLVGAIKFLKGENDKKGKK